MGQSHRNLAVDRPQPGTDVDGREVVALAEGQGAAKKQTLKYRRPPPASARFSAQPGASGPRHKVRDGAVRKDRGAMGETKDRGAACGPHSQPT